ncbi:MAG: hypothetical protein AB7G28_05840 [Pirellulales bacterium]
MLVASLLAAHTSAAELQWRKAAPKRFTPTANSRPIKDDAPAKFAKPKPHRDGAVRAVGFEDDGRGEFEGPSLTVKKPGGDESRSVMVSNEVASESRGAVRSAQLQFQSPSDTSNRYNEQITEPFAPPSTETESTEVELDQEEITLPPAEMQETEPTPPAVTPAPQESIERQPRSFQPAPATNAPRPDPFVEADENPGDGLPNTEDTTLSDEGKNAHADCAKELAALKAHTLDQVDLSIAVTGDPGQDFPVECSIDDGTWHEGRCWDETTYMWKASAICHKPLYFEDEALERYGHSWGPYLDPLVSGAHFFTKLPVLPYCMGVHPPNECMYALGHYRPGNCAPYMIPPVPLSCRGAVFEAGAVVGAAAVLP